MSVGSYERDKMKEYKNDQPSERGCFTALVFCIAATTVSYSGKGLERREIPRFIDCVGYRILIIQDTLAAE